MVLPPISAHFARSQYCVTSKVYAIGSLQASNRCDDIRGSKGPSQSEAHGELGEVLGRSWPIGAIGGFVFLHERKEGTECCG